MPRYALLVAIVIGLAGCPKPPPLPPASDQMGQELAIDDLVAARFLVAYRERASQGRALQGAARVALEGPNFKLNRPQRIAVSRPAKLRFEVLGLFDILAGLLVSDGVEYAYYDVTKPRIERGVVNSDLLWELARLDLDANEVVDLLLAAPKAAAGAELIGVWRKPNGVVTTAFGDPNRRAGAVVDYFQFGVSGDLREFRSVEPGRVTRLHAVFEAYAPVAEDGGERRFPMRVTIRSPKVDAMARFEWKRIMLTNGLPDALFTIPLSNREGG